MHSKCTFSIKLNASSQCGLLVSWLKQLGLKEHQTSIGIVSGKYLWVNELYGTQGPHQEYRNTFRFASNSGQRDNGYLNSIDGGYVKCYTWPDDIHNIHEDFLKTFGNPIEHAIQAMKIEIFGKVEL